MKNNYLSTDTARSLHIRDIQPSTHSTAIVPDKDPLARLAAAFAAQPESAENLNARDHTNDQLIRSATNAGHVSLADQLQADRDRISKCSTVEPCTLIACPRCSARIHHLTCAKTLESSLEHLRKSQQNGLIDVRISAEGDLWDMYQSQVAGLANSFVHSILVPALNKCKQVAGAHIALDIAPTKETLNNPWLSKTGNDDTFPIFENAPVHVHFHVTVATHCVMATEIKPLTDRILAYIEDHHPGLKLESHTTCIKNQQEMISTPTNPNPMRPEYSPLIKSIKYNNKLQVGIKFGPHASTMTRMLRSHLVGHPITWDTGIYSAKRCPTKKTEEDLGRLLRLSGYMASLNAATQAQPWYLSAAGDVKSIKHLVDQWAKSLEKRIALDKKYLKAHGRLELETLWSDATGFDELSRASRHYLAALELIQSRQQTLRDQAIRRIIDLLQLILRLHRESLPLDTSALEPCLRRYFDLLTSADRARQKLYSLAFDSPGSMAILEAIDLLKSGNDVFPCWTPDDRPLELTLTWLSLAADMLFAAPPIHDDLDERLTNLSIPASDTKDLTTTDVLNDVTLPSSERINWVPRTLIIEEKSLNVRQFERHMAGRHPLGIPVHFDIPTEYLSPHSPTFLRDWQLSVIDKMRSRQTLHFRCPRGSGKKWLLAHLPSILPKATILIVTQYKMDAAAILAQLIDRRVTAGPVQSVGCGVTHDRVEVCASKRLIGLECWPFNVILTLDSQLYGDKPLEWLQTLRCDHWYDFAAAAEGKEVRGPKVSSRTLAC